MGPRNVELSGFQIFDLAAPLSNRLALKEESHPLTSHFVLAKVVVNRMTSTTTKSSVYLE